ncbi:hypothetical protein IB229_12875 [Pseudomonas sp. PDM14]|uniref:hypothetical protein n=1 Tax=Pseudomonas sp. PDM14 TaxID=2769288 RepID=UPI001782A0BB|nr:hypothetical protein [Pseudomonas sp. PDM14]MBD9483872.1 hypothetical protein [Pseudomonas sp. PDM14]
MQVNPQEVSEAKATTRLRTVTRYGLVSQATITGCSSDSLSPWFFGKFGFELAEAKPLPFQPCKGRLGFFEIDQVGGGA